MRQLTNSIRTTLLVAVVLALVLPGMAHAEKTLNMALFWMDEHIDPSQQWYGWTLTRTGCGENLVQIDENLEFKAVIAESWKQIDDHTMELNIRKGVTFHNGRPVDAKACKASIERAHKITDRKDMKFPLDSISAEGNKLTIKTSEPYAILANILADPVYIIVDAEAAAKDPEGFKTQPIATGAFKVTSFTPDKGLTLEKHAQHWLGAPAVDKVNVKLIRDANTRTMALQSGEIDMATQLKSMDLKLFKDKAKYKVYEGPNIRIFMVRLNVQRPYMQKLAFRQALAHGISKEVYATKLVDGVPARGPFNSLLPFGDSGDEVYPYDVEKAKALLDKAGIIDGNGDGIREYDGKNITLKYVCSNSGTGGKTIGTAMQAQYKQIGLDLDVVQLENTSDVARKADFDILFSRWTSAPTADPQNFLDASFKVGAVGNYGHYNNPRYEELCKELSTALKPEARYALGQKVSRLLQEDVPAIFLYYGIGNVVTSSKVDGIHRFVSEVYYIDHRVKVQ